MNGQTTITFTEDTAWVQTLIDELERALAVFPSPNIEDLVEILKDQTQAPE